MTRTHNPGHAHPDPHPQPGLNFRDLRIHLLFGQSLIVGPQFLWSHRFNSDCLLPYQASREVEKLGVLPALLVAIEITQQRPFKKGRVYRGSWFEGVGYHGEGVEADA